MDMRVLSFKVLPGGLVEAGFSDGKTRQVDFSSPVSADSALAPLAVQAVLEQFAVRQEGLAVSWPGGLELSAIALYDLGKPRGREAGVPGSRSTGGPTGTLRKHDRRVSKARG
jgi:hypothetical protein